MLYFRDFSNVLYRFGNETDTVSFNDITTYIDIIDQIKDNIAFYQNAYVREGLRPDQLSIELYGTPIYYWTFFLMNDNLKIQGWPMTNAELFAKMQTEYNHTCLTFRTYFDAFDAFGERIDTKFAIGRTITSPSASGTIVHRNLDLGQVFVKVNSGTFEAGELAVSNAPDRQNDDAAVIAAVSEEYNAAHHYKDVDGRTVDVDPILAPPAQYTEVTFYDRAFEQNEDLRRIKVITSSQISTVVASFKQAIRSTV